MSAAGVTCIFAALCYAEFASMAPVAGSAYTYAYTTLGELFAWIIGWDLVLEYAVGAATVANGWSSLLPEACWPSFNIVLPESVRGARPEVRGRPQDSLGGEFVPTDSFINLPAVIIVALSRRSWSRASRRAPGSTRSWWSSRWPPSSS